MSNRPTPTVLTIAGFDPYGGAGVGLDSKVIHALGGYAYRLITAMTAQNSLGVVEVTPIPLATFEKQLHTLLTDVKVDALKIGMLATKEMVEVVANAIVSYKIQTVVLDTILVSSSGKLLLEEDAIKVMVNKLFPLVTLITPNIPETNRLLGASYRGEASEIEAMAQGLFALGANSILIKGGHSPNTTYAIDYLIDAKETKEAFSSKRIETTHTHGTGCFLSSAIATELAKGNPLPLAIKKAKRFLFTSMKEATQTLNLSYHQVSKKRREPLL